MPVHVPATMGPYSQHVDQTQPQLSVAPTFFPVTADISPATMPALGMDGPSTLDIGPGQQPMMLAPQYDMHHSLRSIPEADRATSYHPNAVMQHLMAARAGSSYMQNTTMPLQPQGQSFTFDGDAPNGLPSGLPNDVQFPVPTNISTANDTSEDDQYGGFGEYISYLPLINPQNDLQIPADPLSADDSPYSGAQSNETNQSSIEPNPGSVASITSKFSGWTDLHADVDTKQDNDHEDFFSYNMPQASASEANFCFPNNPGQGFPRVDMYQHSNASAHAVLSSPHRSGRSISSGPGDLEPPNFGDEGFARRNSSTSNLASTIEAIHIQNTTPEGFKSPTQSSIAARRQKRPTALNSNTLRSASYSGSMPSPGNNGDHTLRRIRSSGIGNAGRVQKPQPSSAQRSPMSLSFSDAASSPKFQRTMSSSSITTVGQNGSLAPPTPQTPNDRPFPYWQNNVPYRNHASMPDHSSPESLGTNWAVDGGAGAFMNSESPPSLEVAHLHQARLGEMYRDTPPQSAPATQQGFPSSNLMQPPQMRAGFHSSTDLTLQHPKPSHFRRPSLPVDAQGQADDPNALFAPSYNNFKFDDFNEFPLNSIHHNVPFAPPVSAMPDFLVNQYVPQGDGVHGHMRRTTAPEAKNYIFANQGPRDFRSS